MKCVVCGSVSCFLGELCPHSAFFVTLYVFMGTLFLNIFLKKFFNFENVTLTQRQIE